MSAVDPAIFYWRNKNQTEGLIALHVDDIFYCGTDDFRNLIIKQLQENFKIRNEQSETFKYLGLSLSCKNGEIGIDQNAYVNDLRYIPVDKSRLNSEVLNKDETKLLQSAIGQILWAANQTRPDISCFASVVASKISDATIKTLHEVNKVIRKLKHDKVTLKFQNLGDKKLLKFLVFSDASFANLKDGHTQGGFIVAISGPEGKFSLLCWSSKRLKRVARSTISAESLALADGVDAAIFLATLYSELTTGIADFGKIPIECITDSKSLKQAILSTKPVTEKRLRVELAGFKQLMELNKIDTIKHCESKNQIANCLTKLGASSHLLLQIVQRGILHNY